MFERLFKRKNIFSYIPAFLVAFCSLTIGINPFSSAMFAVMVEEKIPVLVPFLFTSIIQLLLFGYENALSFLIFAVIYSIIKAFSNNKQKYNSDDIIELVKTFSLRVFMASLISEGILLLTGIEELSEIPNIICLVLSVIVFSIVFMYAFKYYYYLIKENDNNIKFIHVASFLVMSVICASLIKYANVLNINLWIAISIILLMIAVWRKNIVFAIMASLLTSLIFVLCGNISFGIIILTLVVGVVTTLLSKANRKGAFIGLVFSFIVLLFVTVNNDGTSSELRIKKDYYDFLRNNMQHLSGDELKQAEEELARYETLTKIQEESKNTLSSFIIKCMVLGFFVLCVIPYKYLEYVDRVVPDAPSPKQIRERLFRVSKIYWLNPGNDDK